MKLAWISDDAKRICISKTGLVDLWPASARRAQTLLNVIGHAHDVTALRQLRSVVVKLGGEAGLTFPRLSISLEEVEMHAYAVTDTGELIVPQRDEGAWHELGTSKALLVHELLASDQRLIGAA